MSQSPLAVTLATADEPGTVELEVSFVAEDERAPLDLVLFGGQRGPVAAASSHGSSSAPASDDRAQGRADGADGDRRSGPHAGWGGVRQAALALGARVLGAAGAVHVLGGMPLRAVVGLGPHADITLETL